MAWAVDEGGYRRASYFGVRPLRLAGMVDQVTILDLEVAGGLSGIVHGHTGRLEVLAARSLATSEQILKGSGNFRTFHKIHTCFMGAIAHGGKKLSVASFVGFTEIVAHQKQRHHEGSDDGHRQDGQKHLAQGKTAGGCGR